MRKYIRLEVKNYICNKLQFPNNGDGVYANRIIVKMDKKGPRYEIIADEYSKWTIDRYTTCLKIMESLKNKWREICT